MKFIDKSKEQKECRKFTISNESKKSQALQFRQAGEKSKARNPRGPASQVARGMPRRARTEREVSICFSGDVGQRVISSKR